MTEYCSPEKDKAALITISAQHDFVQAGSPLCAKGHIRAVPALSRVVGPGPVEVMLVYYPRLKEGMGMPAEKRFYLKEIDDDE